MDGHSSHYSPAAICLAAEQEVILLTLPPNTTHVTQPLDKGCFGPLKGAHGKAGLGHGHGYLRMSNGGTRLLDVPILPLLM